MAVKSTRRSKMGWWENPGFGIYTDEEIDTNSKRRCPSSGAEFVSKSSGMWCPKCLERGFYSWLDYVGKDKSGKPIYKRCPERNTHA